MARVAKLDPLGHLLDGKGPSERLAGLAGLLDELPGTFPLKGAPESEVAHATEALANFLVAVQRAASRPQDEVDLASTKTALLERALASRSSGGVDTHGYLTADGGRTGILFVRPTYTRDEISVVQPFVNTVRRVCEEELRRHQGVSYGLTGIPATAVEELLTIQKDTMLTTSVALVGVVLLFLIYFPALRLLLISLVPIGFGVIWTAAVIKVVFGFLNLMSSIFLIILIGMGIDFSVHLIARFLELRRSGLNSDLAASGAVERAGRGILTGGVTSAGAFLAVGWCGFKGIEELGIAAAIGLILTLGAALSVGPAVLALFGPSIQKTRQGFPGLSSLIRTGTRHPAKVLVGAVIVSLFLGVLAFRTPFDFSLLNLLPEDAESARLMKEMVDKRELSADAIVSVAESLEEARQREDAFRELSSVHRAVSAATFLPPDQEARLQKIRFIHETLEGTRARVEALRGPPPSLSEAVARLETGVERLSELMFSAGLSQGVDHLETGLEALEDLQEQLKTPEGQARAEKGLGRLNAQLDPLRTLPQRLASVVAAGPLRPEELPTNLRTRFVSQTGRFAVYATPKQSIWEREALGEFLEETREVDPDLTGFPATFYENSGLIQTAFAKAAVYASLAVFFLLFLDFRRLGCVFLAALPVACGGIWMLGGMYTVGLPYNLANIVGLPLIIGVGIDNGVHLLHRYLQERNVTTAAVRTGGAVVLSSLTTMVGFGSLALASHRGYSSLGRILFLGVGACLMSAIVVLPAALAWFEAKDR